MDRLGSSRYEDDPGANVLNPETPQIPAGATADPDQALDFCDLMFAESCRSFAASSGKAVWGEKTPRHVFRIDEILSAFPRARILCMVRDSRAVVCSYRDWPKALQREARTNEAGTGHIDRSAEMRRRIRSYNTVLAAMLWRAAVNAGRRAQVVHGADRVRIVSYERLVEAPEETLRGVADWLQVRFDSRCVHVPMQNSSTRAFDPIAGVVRGQVDLWRKGLGAVEIALVEWITGRQMRALGYRLDEARPSSLILAQAMLTLPFGILRAGWANRNRMGSVIGFLTRRLRSLRD